MKRLFTLTLLALLTFTSMSAQRRYIDQVFPSVKVTENVVYGTNATVLLFATQGAIPQQLVMDVYEPLGDANVKRPVIVYMHTGNFLPISVNGSCGGTLKDSVMVEVATRLAKMGYVVGVAAYRLGWNPQAATPQDRSESLINAAYRGIQDARTCNRFFRKNASTYKIDTTKMGIWGQGTGGYIAMATATLDDYLEIPQTPKFVKNVGGTPVPMVIPQINGDPYGLEFGILRSGGTTGTPVDTFCYPNHPGYSSEFQLCVNLGGALADTSWFRLGGGPTKVPPMISYHVPGDRFAPYSAGTVIVPGLNLPVVDVQGSYLVQKAANLYRVNQRFVAANFNDAITVKAKAAVALDPLPAQRTYFEALYAFVRDSADSAPWEWSALPGRNCNANKATATSAIDTIIGFFAPRAIVALNLPTSTKDLLSPAQYRLDVMPNPASESMFFQTDDNLPMQSIEVYDLTGRIVLSYRNVNNHNFNIFRNGLSSGLYVAKVQTEKGVLSKKIIFE
jgi:hypothetical protein